MMNENLLDVVADALVDSGYILLEQALPHELLQALLSHFNSLTETNFKRAGIGRQTDFQLQDSIRSDHIYWLDDLQSVLNDSSSEDKVIKPFLQWMENFRIGLNRRLFLGLFDYESHFASYAQGTFYKKHLDAFRGQCEQGQPNRVLSTVIYLNEDWSENDGGELLLYAEDGEQLLQTISPTFGRLIVFLSEKFPHEVLPATRERKSIAGWFRVNNY